MTAFQALHPTSIATFCIVAAVGGLSLLVALDWLLRAFGAFPRGFIAPLARAWLLSIKRGPEEQ